eukprot:7382905-Prymnesium_polylepis.1
MSEIKLRAETAERDAKDTWMRAQIQLGKASKEECDAFLGEKQAALDNAIEVCGARGGRGRGRRWEREAGGNGVVRVAVGEGGSGGGSDSREAVVAGGSGGGRQSWREAAGEGRSRGGRQSCDGREEVGGEGATHTRVGRVRVGGPRMRVARSVVEVKVVGGKAAYARRPLGCSHGLSRAGRRGAHVRDAAMRSQPAERAEKQLAMLRQFFQDSDQQTRINMRNQLLEKEAEVTTTGADAAHLSIAHLNPP